MTYKEKIAYYIIMLMCLAGVILATSCKKWEQINFLPDKHTRFSAMPQVHNWRAFEFKLTEKSIYYHNSVDQYDWNKLRGFYSLQACNPMSYADCGMIGWRYLPDSGFQITPYTHPECGERLWEKAIPVELGQVCTVQIEANDRWKYTIQVGDSVYRYFHPRKHRAKVFKQMNGYFGGTTPTPHHLRYYVHDLKQKVW